ncbi:hypothetical protein SUGI_0099270 [Cryptomeria japonica]|nr:hypothetical protein SUGI_0099270 [Cryptomeria japonica]
MIQELFDKDWFSRDDPMGKGEVVLGNLASAARMLNTSPPMPSFSMENKQGCWCIRCVDGQHMVQEVCLNLHKVESGRLELHIKWIDGTF